MTPFRESRQVNRCTHLIVLTLSEEQVVTLEAAMMKSRISMVAPGRPMLKNLGLQCFMMVFTMSCKAQQAHSAPRPSPARR